MFIWFVLLTNFHQQLNAKWLWNLLWRERSSVIRMPKAKDISCSYNVENPRIILLDEATSALDISSENLVQEALEKTMINRTCQIVTHRLSTVQKSNTMLVVESGRIAEEGSHDELLAKGENGAHYALVKLQHQAAVK